jgi:hypothetical protein
MFHESDYTRPFGIDPLCADLSYCSCASGGGGLDFEASRSEPMALSWVDYSTQQPPSIPHIPDPSSSGIPPVDSTYRPTYGPCEPTFDPPAFVSPIDMTSMYDPPMASTYEPAFVPPVTSTYDFSSTCYPSPNTY